MEELKIQLRIHIAAIQALLDISRNGGFLMQLSLDLECAQTPSEVANILAQFERWKDGHLAA